MSLSTFFQQTKTQIKSAISIHPIEIFMIAAFALGIWFVDMNSEKDHLAYWLFEPMLLAFIYLFISPIFLVSFFMDCASHCCFHHLASE